MPTMTISDQLAAIAAQGVRLDSPTVLPNSPFFKSTSGMERARLVAAYMISSTLTENAGQSKSGWSSPGDTRVLAERIVALLPDELLTTTGIQNLDLLPLLRQVAAPQAGEVAQNYDGTPRTVTANEAKDAAQALTKATERYQADRAEQLRATGAGLGKSGAELDSFVTENLLPQANTVLDVRPTAAGALAQAGQTPTGGPSDTAPTPDQVAADAFNTSDPTNILLNGVDSTTTTGPVDASGNPLPTPITEENLRNIFSTGDLQWNDLRSQANLRAAWEAQGFPSGVSPVVQLTPEGPRGSGNGISDGGTPMGLLDAAQEIGLRTKDEITKAQQRMVDAGYLEAGKYRPGIADAETRDAWRKVVMEAWNARKDVTSLLVDGANSIDQARQQAQAQQAKNATHQITDPRQVRDLANKTAQTLIGRDLTDQEVAMIQAKIQREEVAQDQANTQGATYYQPDISSAVEEWLTLFRPQQMGLQQNFVQQQQIAKLRGQKPHYVDRKWSDMQWMDFANHVRVNNWSEAQVFAALTGTPFEQVNALGGLSGKPGG